MHPSHGSADVGEGSGRRSPRPRSGQTAVDRDAILMDHFSRLGPIDPQLYIEGNPIPTSVLSYLEQFERLVRKSEEGTLTSAELVLLQKLDLADLRQYELAAELSVKLIRDWLVQYKFKDWSSHSSTGQGGNTRHSERSHVPA